MIRLFVAIPLSLDIREKLSTLQAQLKKTLPPMKWVRPDSLHLTLKFLGSVDPSRVPELLAVLETIGSKRVRFSIEVQQLGVFPHIKWPRIFWIGVRDKTQGLEDMVSKIEVVLEPLGFPLQDTSYHPHLTLARIKHDNALVGSALVEHKVLEAEQSIAPMLVNQFTLFQSDLHSSGAIYRPLGMVRLWDNPSEQQDNE